ncbi:TldD/PmbA family protein [Dielma fastidiosa]|uniref:TldD/PmbA family protein n=1 Tax=Dielma fastidiosa TaxID=1034346 RepID=UPI000EEE0168|nr:TldD/PmbA family protein [Dielma fastidiosa]HAH93750.1 TldD/PmbA family protein [Dielma fastidiosa]
MFNYPKNLYTDVRIETVMTTNIVIENDQLKANKSKREKGALIRIYDGRRWYYKASSEVEKLQEAIDELALMAEPNEQVMDTPIVKKLEVNKDTLMVFDGEAFLNTANDEKMALVKHCASLIDADEIKMWQSIYQDRRIVKDFYSSKGSELHFDTQSYAMCLRYVIEANGQSHGGSYDVMGQTFDQLLNHDDEYKREIAKDIEYIKHAVPVKPGMYTVVMAPSVTGVFAHESFGHKSESDFMVGDETMLKEWELGRQVGCAELSIEDRGDWFGNGYVPYDDEGTKAKSTQIITHGILSGRLHSAATAAALNEEVSGNARAMNFQFEPLVRMTGTYIKPGKETIEEVFAPIKEGVYIECINHGSGMSTFTIAPRRAYMIRDGKIAEPVQVSVITGNVMETLYHIEALSTHFEALSFALGGCGKMEQWPLPVAFGGPYMRVSEINVQ